MDMPFEPLQRARSNTWPLPRPDNFDENGQGTAIKVEPSEGDCNVGDEKCLQTTSVLHTAVPCSVGQMKKNTSRRNAWGNLSYADLITQAISSSPDSRLTLSQIYEWMVHNVGYFKDKGDNNSSAGWKNSIRHNLSLHNRFMRVQNEGTGKSSWWMLNPDAKPGKSARRRATSMETSKFEKRRGRVKKKVEALRNGQEATPSPSSSVSETLDLFPDSPVVGGFPLSPDFRTRASSNASSCGRLSPIPAIENDWTFNTYMRADQLAGSLEHNMKLNSNDPFLYEPPPAYQSISQTQVAAHNPAPPPYGIPYTALSQQCNPFQLDLKHHNLSPMSKSPNGSPTVAFSGDLGNINPNFLDDLNINFETADGEFDCNVDEVIRHELSIEGFLDFNFPAPSTQPATSTSQQPPTSNHDQSPFDEQPWVH